MMTTDAPLTEPQKRVLAFLERWPFLYSPTYREIGAGIERDVSAVHATLRQLRELGYVDYKDGLSRTLRLVRRP